VMLVYCPHAEILPETRAALDASGYAWEARDVAVSDGAYTELLASLWAAREAFAIVEHDVIPHPEALAELEACPEPFCAFEYPYQGRMHAGLGCARFAASLLAAVPDAVEQTLAESTEAHPAGHWCQLDDRLSRVLTRHGYAKHVHSPAVGHLRPWPSHGCS
jgi:hypothetical protein